MLADHGRWLAFRSGDQAGAELGALVSESVGDAPIALFVDQGFRRHWTRFVDEMIAALPRTIVIDVPAKESSKSVEFYRASCRRIFTSGYDRDIQVVAMGGGITLNLGGFIASTLHRGVPLTQIPTTLLAQVDAAIDVKHALNLSSIKNAIGSIYEPRLIVVETQFLDTLPARVIQQGYAEIIKHGLCEGGALYHEIADCNQGERGRERLARLVEATITAKARLVREREAGGLKAELTLQYGHSIAHAIEGASRNRVSHGEAVAIGMWLSALIAQRRGCGSPDLASHHLELLRRYKLSVLPPPNLDREIVAELLKHDRYHKAGRIRMGLLERVGGFAPIQASEADLSWVTIDEIVAAFDCARSKM